MSSPNHRSPWLIVSSLAVSVLLFMHVKSLAALKVPIKVDLPLRYVGLDEDRYVVKNIPTTVAIQVIGTDEEKDRFKSLKPNSVYAIVDLTDSRPELGNYRVRLPKTDAIERTGVEMRLLNDDVAIIIEEVVERETSVTVDPYNAPAGLMFSTADVKPDKVRLKGPVGDLARVDMVRARVDLSKANGHSVPVTVEVLDKSQRQLESVRSLPREVTVYPQLAKVAPTKSVLVSVVIANGSRPAPGFQLVDFEVVPSTVLASGEMTSLSSLKSLKTEAIRLDGMDSSRTISARLAAPRGLTLDKNRVDVRLKIEPIPAIGSPIPTSPTSPPTGGVKPTNTKTGTP